jgi:hypothetical protein
VRACQWCARALFCFAVIVPNGGRYFKGEMAMVDTTTLLAYGSSFHTGAGRHEGPLAPLLVPLACCRHTLLERAACRKFIQKTYTGYTRIWLISAIL